MSAWTDLTKARLHWPDAASIADAVLTDLLDAAQIECERYAQPLPEATAPSVDYVLAVILQARELYNAGQRDSADLVGIGDYAVRARPLPAHVKRLLPRRTPTPA